MTSDAALVLRARGGDESAWDELLSRHHNLIRLKVSTYFLVGGEDADLMQEGRVGLFKAVRDYRPDKESSFRNFAELCIRRQIITAVKTATREKHRPLNEHVALTSKPTTAADDSESTYASILPGPWHNDPVERLGIEEDFVAVVACLNSNCSTLEREAATRFADGESYEEIAGCLNVSTKTIDNAIQRVRRKVGAALQVAAA